MTEGYVPLEKVLGATGGSIYKLTILAAKRAVELAEGDKPLVEKRSEKLLDIALVEIENQKIKEAKGKKKKTQIAEENKEKEKGKEEVKEEKSSAR